MGTSPVFIAILISPATDSRGYTEVLFLPEHNTTQEKWTGPKLGPDNPEASRVTGFDRVVAMAIFAENQYMTKLMPRPNTSPMRSPCVPRKIHSPSSTKSPPRAAISTQVLTLFTSHPSLEPPHGCVS